MKPNLTSSLQLAAILAAFASLGAAQSQQPPIVRPGAPGGTSKTVSSDEAADLSATRFAAADVLFMQEMIAHHGQALKMAGVAAARAEKDTVRNLAKDLTGTLEADVTMMKEWLTARGQKLDAPPPEEGHVVPGTAKGEEMTQLEQAKG